MEHGMSALTQQRKDIDLPGPGGIKQVRHHSGGTAPGDAEGGAVRKALGDMFGRRASHGTQAQGLRASRIRDHRDLFDPGLLHERGG